MTRAIPILVAALWLASCSAQQVPVGSATLGPDPALGGGTFTSPGGITVAVDARDIGGRTGICGVWAESTNQSVMTRNSGPKILTAGGVALGGETVAQGLRFLRQVEPATSYAGLEANCITTDRVWRQGDEARELQIVLPQMIIRNELDGDLDGGGILIWFRPGGPSAHPSDRKPWDPPTRAGSAEPGGVIQ
ncbi:MAG: hypothetical protein Q4P24_11955 [Rhodobacterales bacterium]|nr:hypothetical protein [Rhodobacterales bacterium]